MPPASARAPRSARCRSPPVAVRPKRLSVTEIETLLRSPYDIYARHVLRLRALDPLGQAPGGRERGTMIHEVFAQFVAREACRSTPSAVAPSRGAGRRGLRGPRGHRRAPRHLAAPLRRAAGLFLEFERSRHADIAERHAEIKGEWTFPDRLHPRRQGRPRRRPHDGTLEILDFKTGAIPRRGEMKDFIAPQLLLEAAMAQASASFR